MEDFWQLVTLDDKKAVGFAHLAGHLGEVLVRSGTDADLDEGRDLTRDGGFYFATDRFDGLRLAQVVGQPRPHFVDREHGLDVDAFLDGGDDLVVNLDVFARLAFDDGDTGAEQTCVTDAGAGFHSKRLGFVAGSDAAGAFRHDWSYAHGSSAQAGIEVLFDRSEVGIAVDKKGGQGSVHGREKNTRRHARSN